MTSPMPLPVQADIDLLTKLDKEAAIYINCTKPADGADVALNPATGAPAGGTWIGVTQDMAEWAYKPTVTGMKIEQTNIEVAPRNTAEVVNLTFKAAKAVYSNLQLALPSSTLTTNAGATTTAGSRTLAIGGKSDIATQCVVLVSNIGTYVYMSTTVQLYEWFVMYNAVTADGVKVPYLRNATRMYQLNLQGWGDATRTVGDQLCKVGFQFDPANP